MGNKSKQIKQIVEDFEQKYSSKDRSIRPSFAHASLNPVKTKDKATKISSILSELTYQYVLTSFLNEEGKHEINILIETVGKDGPPVFEQYTFDPSQKQEIFGHITIPSLIFDLEEKEKMVITFDQVRWSRKEFNEYITLWIKDFQT